MKRQRQPDRARRAASRAAAKGSAVRPGGGDHEREAQPGFWNSIPLEEERIPMCRTTEPYGTNGRSSDIRTLGWINIRELTLFLGLTYSAAACARLAIVLLDWPL